jgi:uncharacterized protein (UPF0248 family)
MQVKASRIRTLGKSYFTLVNDSEEEGEESLIPFHRILQIRNTIDGSILWLNRKAAPVKRES